MEKPRPMGTPTRPAWGCLDAEEILAAATARAGDPVIKEHLARCAECRRAVDGVSRELRRPDSSPERGYGGRMLARPRFWLAILAIALLAFRIVAFLTRKLEEPKRVAPAPVAVPADPPSVSPTPTPRDGKAMDAEIVAAIRRNQASVKGCYERSLKRDHDLRLRLEVQVNVRATGTVESVSIDTPTGAREVTSCIRHVIKTWRFPRAQEGYTTAFPLRLQQSP